jgi:hypothetical protein
MTHAMSNAWFCRCAVGAAALLGVVCATAARAGDDKSTLTAVGELLGVASDKSVNKIDYSERPKLVMPPKAGLLPPPREKAEPPPGWPTDADGGQRRTDRYARAPNAPPEKPKTGLLERTRGPVANTGAGADDEPGFFQRMITARARAAAAEPDEPTRHLLAEPPDGYRHPTQDLSKVKEDVKGSGGLLGSLSSMVGGSSNDGDPVARTATPSEPMAKPAAAAAGGGSSILSGLGSVMPGFMRGSDQK